VKQKALPSKWQHPNYVKAGANAYQMSNKNSFSFQMGSILRMGGILNQVPAKRLEQKLFFSFRKARYRE
jgi:hypothetical protein